MIYEDLKGKRVLVTGASSGIGAATAVMFAQQGCFVGVHYFATEDGAKKTLQEVKKHSDGLMLKADVRDKKQVQKMVTDFAAKAGGIDILINNAGTLIGRQPFETAPEEFYDDVFAINTKSVFLAAQAALGYLKKGKSANIVNTGSIAAPPHTLTEQTTGFTIQTTAMWTATQIIAHANPDAATLAGFQKALQIAHDNQKFYFDLTSARLWVNDAIERTFSASGSVSKLQLDAMQRSLNLSPQDLSRWQSLDKIQTTAKARELFLSLEPEVKKMPWELRSEGINLAAQIDQMTKGNVLLEHYRPDIGNNADLPFRCRAQTEAVITICAVKRYVANNKAIPPTLKVLVVSGFLRAEPLDPYRDGSLSYMDLPNDFRLYSWGADFTDNFARASNWGQGPEGGDEVFWPIP
jgi:NAD(P)-dependent dehydrogenase (short-subunit alcohol dehydrogenase family)